MLHIPLFTSPFLRVEVAKSTAGKSVASSLPAPQRRKTGKTPADKGSKTPSSRRGRGQKQKRDETAEVDDDEDSLGPGDSASQVLTDHRSEDRKAYRLKHLRVHAMSPCMLKSFASGAAFIRTSVGVRLSLQTYRPDPVSKLMCLWSEFHFNYESF